jgi:hypothetical protein
MKQAVSISKWLGGMQYYIETDRRVARFAF